MAPRYTYNHDPSTISDLINAIASHKIEYSTNPQILTAKAHTPHSPANASETPLAVFLPRSTNETSIILKACHERRVAVTSFSGGTSFGGALAAVKGGVCVSFERMKELVRLNEDDLDVVVQPGLGWVELNERLKDKGLFFPVDPAPGAKIGGMVSCISSVVSIRWGLLCGTSV